MRQTNLENEIRQKYAGLTYEELVEAAQRENLSDLAFIMAQPGLSGEFEEYMEDMGIDEYDEETATHFLLQRDNAAMDLMDDESNYLMRGSL